MITSLSLASGEILTPQDQFVGQGVLAEPFGSSLRSTVITPLRQIVVGPFSGTQRLGRHRPDNVLNELGSCAGHVDKWLLGRHRRKPVVRIGVETDDLR